MTSKWMWKPESLGHRWDDRAWWRRFEVGTGEDNAGSIDGSPSMVPGVALTDTNGAHLTSLDTSEAKVSRSNIWHGKSAANVYVLGRRTQGWASTSVFGDCAAYLDTSQNLVNAVSPATTYYIRSTSTEDVNTTGTGAWKVRIVYLDAAGDQQVKEATMNGTTAVSLGSGHSYFQWMEVSAVGTNQTSVGQVNIGTVNGAQTVASTVDCILAGGNRSMCARYKVPTAHTAYLTQWGSYSVGTNMDARLRGTVFADDRSLSTVFHFQASAYLASGNHDDDALPYMQCPAGAEIKVSAIPGNAPAGNRLDCFFHMIVVAN